LFIILKIIIFFYRYIKDCHGYDSYVSYMADHQGCNDKYRYNLDWTPLQKLSKLTVLYVHKKYNIYFFIQFIYLLLYIY